MKSRHTVVYEYYGRKSRLLPRVCSTSSDSRILHVLMPKCRQLLANSNPMDRSNAAPMEKLFRSPIACIVLKTVRRTKTGCPTLLDRCGYTSLTALHHDSGIQTSCQTDWDEEEGGEGGVLILVGALNVCA